MPVPIALSRFQDTSDESIFRKQIEIRETFLPKAISSKPRVHTLHTPNFKLPARKSIHWWICFGRRTGNTKLKLQPWCYCCCRVPLLLSSSRPMFKSPKNLATVLTFPFVCSKTLPDLPVLSSARHLVVDDNSSSYFRRL